MPRQIIIHAGTPKTGTTAIQKFCRDNAAALSRRGLFWPRTGTEQISHNHIALVEALRQPGSTDVAFAALSRELDAAGHPGRMLISAEHFYFHLADPHYVERLAGFCARMGYTPHLLVYVRPQAAALNSYYTQYIKNWRALASIQQFINAEMVPSRHAYIEHLAPALARFAGHVTIKPYSRKMLEQGIAGDFLKSLGLDASSHKDVKPIETVNAAPGPKTIAAFIQARRQLLEAVPGYDVTQLSAFTRPFIAAAGTLGWNDQKFWGIAPESQARITSRYAESNERLAQFAWGLPWSSVFEPADDILPDVNIFKPALAPQAERRAFRQFVSQLVETIIQTTPSQDKQSETGT